MKDIRTFVTESAEESSKLGSKIDNIIKKNPNKLAKIIQTRQDHWDSNMNDWSREPMFLIAGPTNDLNIGAHRDYSWVRWKNIKGHKDDIKGTFKNYNIVDGENGKPNSVIGIYYDRHFEIIYSLDVFGKLYDLINKEYDKHYNNLYENVN